MYKLTVISGPNRGSTYAISPGETTLGRISGNVIVLSSAKVSKRHCSLVVDSTGVTLKDQGSSNGTLVNGTLAKVRKLKVGDRISVGEYVFELDDPTARAPKLAPAVPGAMAPVGFGAPAAVRAPSLSMPQMGSSMPNVNAAPTDLKGKAIWFLENRLMPIFYGLNLKHEWRFVLMGLFGVFVVANLAVSVQPLLESGRVAVRKEAARRAKFMARQMADQNASALGARQETKVEIGGAETADGVRMAIVTDLENRIIAPASKVNQYLTGGREASAAIRARDEFRAGKETGILSYGTSTVTAIEPVKVFHPAAGRNVPVGMAIVSIDTSISTPDLGEMGVVYSETLILTGILGALILFIIYKVTLKPFHVLSDDMDKVLKGEIPQVTQEFKLSELAPLWDLVNSALKRVPKGGADVGADTRTLGIDELSTPIRMVGEIGKFAVAVCDSDRRLSYLNSLFEEITGIRSDAGVGQALASVARDQGFAAFATDLMDRVASNLTPGDVVSEEIDFSGIRHRVLCSGFGSPGAIKGFVFTAVKMDG